MSDDAIMDRIVAAIGQLHAGDRDGARTAFTAIWTDLAGGPDPYHVCTLSHYMADVQDDVLSELEWDLRALEAADRVTDDRVRRHHASLTIASFYPSLHLNAGDSYLRAGEVALARDHARAAGLALQNLPASPLADLTRKGITALIARVEEAAADLQDG